MVDSAMDTLETRQYHFLHHKYCSDTFWEEEQGAFNGDGLFHHRVQIGERCAAATIDGSSNLNLVSIEVVEKLQLHKFSNLKPYLLRSSYGTLLISHTAEVPFTFGEHTEIVRCDVSPMPLDSCHVLLGDPWCRKFQVRARPEVNKISFMWNMKRGFLLRNSADDFHEYHLLRKERRKEFSLSAKYMVIMDGDISIICHVDHIMDQIPCENESHIAKLSESVIKSELCDSTKREDECIHFESMREQDNMSVVDDRTCEDISANVTISPSSVVSCDMQVAFEERELSSLQPASPLEEPISVPTTSEEFAIEKGNDFELQPASASLCEYDSTLTSSSDLIHKHISAPCDNLLNSNFDHVVLITHKEILAMFCFT